MKQYLYFIRANYKINVMVGASEFQNYVDELELQGCEIKKENDGNVYIINRGEEKILVGFERIVEI